MTQTTPPGWYRDPTGLYDYRHWNGSGWSNQVSKSGTTMADPTALDSTVASTPPAPRSAAPASQPPPAPQQHVTQRSGSSAAGWIAAALGDDSTPVTEPPATTEAPSEPSSDS